MYLFPSKLTEMLIAAKTSETNTKNKSFKKLDVVKKWKSDHNVFIHFQVFYILLYKYSLEQAKNVLNVAKSQHLIKTLVILSLSLTFYHYIVLKCL